MDEHTGQPVPDPKPDPLLSPLHEGQLSLIPDAEQPARDYVVEDDDRWTPILGEPTSVDVEPAASDADTGEADDRDAGEAAETTDDTAAPFADAVPSGDEQAGVDSDELASPDDGAPGAEDAAADEESSAQESDDLSEPSQDGAEAASEAAEPLAEETAADTEAGEPGETAWPTLTMPATGASVYDLPPLDRPRPSRDRYVPRWVYIAAASTVLVVALVVGGLFWYLSSSQVAVPDVTGLQLTEATERLERAGLDVQVTDRRFSAAPRDEVIDQDPDAGNELRRGSTVRLVVSAGTEEIVMPDLVGQGLTTAKADLEGRGLVVIVDAVPSDAPSDTVLGTTPAAGAIVRTGDSVRVTVASPIGGSSGLSPYSLQGLGVVIDPAPTGTGTDTTMEVARRLRSLLEASGATVSVLRSATETNAPDAVRAQAASTATGTIGIGLSVIGTGAAGRHVSIPVTGTPDALQRAELLASSITSQLATVAPPVTSSTSSTETVLQATRLPWARIVLGSTAARPDVNRFADPVWADQMARAIYNALGRLYGVREQ